MPELPEVETIKLQLQKYLIGHTVKDVVVNFPKKVKGDLNLVKNKKIVDVGRMAKMIVINFTGDLSVTIHPKMTGQFLYIGKNLEKPFNYSKKITGGVPGKHTIVDFILDNNSHFYFNDYRRFGWIEINKKLINSLGPEPMKDLTLKYFESILKKSKHPIKLLLLDQNKISGIGNIYACDALWLSKIHPSTPSNLLSLQSSKRLFEAIKKVLKVGIANGGSSENAYVRPDGSEGAYQDKTLVYDRKGEPCRICKTPIEKYKLSGRGTYFCRNCQPLK